MTSSVGALVLCSKHEEFIDLTLASLKGVADQVVIVGDPDETTRELIMPFLGYKWTWVFRAWDGDYGAARNEALSYLKTDWVLAIDADEVLADNHVPLYWALREYENKDVILNVEHVHFIRDLGHIDAQYPEHWGHGRFWKRAGQQYSEGIHEVLKDVKPIGNLLGLKVYHLGYLKSVRSVAEKYAMNMARKDRKHEVGYLDWWKDAHLFGTFPVKEIRPDSIDSHIIKEAFKV